MNATEEQIESSAATVADADAGEALKKEGQTQVAGHNGDFIRQAVAIVREHFAATKQPFAFDAVRLKCEQLGIKPMHPNAWGALPRSCRKFIRADATKAPVASTITSARARKMPYYIGV